MNLAPSAPFVPAPTSPIATRPAGARADAQHRRRRLRLLRHALVGAGVLASVAGVALALRPRPVPVDVARATRGPLVVAVEESGITRVKDRYVVSAPVAGSLSRMLLDPGDPVKEGDALAEIAPAASPLLDVRARDQAEATLGAALSSLGQARAQKARAAAARELSLGEVDRSRRLAASGAISHEALEQAEFADRMRAEELTSTDFAGRVAAEEVRVAQAALAPAGEGRRGRHVGVVAPVSGAVLKVLQRSANVVQPGAPLLEIGDPAALEIVVDLLTTDAVHVKQGTAVTLHGWGGEEALAGRVRQIEPSGFTRPSALGVDEQRVNVVIALTEPRHRWASLGDGYRVEARLVLWQADDVLRVPQGAVFRRGGGWAVFRLDGGVARLTRIEIGHRGEADVEVLSGLAAASTVAVHPGDRVTDGARVTER